MPAARAAPCTGAAGAAAGSEPRASLGLQLHKRCHRELTALSQWSKAELDRHKIFSGRWICSISQGSEEKHLTQTLSIPKEVLGLHLLVLRDAVLYLLATCPKAVP